MISSKLARTRTSRNPATSIATMIMTKFSTLLRQLQLVVTGMFLAGFAMNASAQVETATTTPTKVYAAVGQPFSFVVSYTGGEVAVTDLVVTYTANTTGASIAPFSTACIPGAFTPPYASANPNEFYINWEPSSGSYPASCGGAANAAAMATFNGTASSFVGGTYVITVTNNASLGATNSATNDVTVCEKTTVSSVTPGSNPTEGGASNFTVNFSAVPTGCGGFSIPVGLSGPAVAGKSAAIGSNTCTNIADGATSCTVGITTAQNTNIDGNMLATLTVTDSTAASNYVSAGRSASVDVLDDEVGASVAATTAAASETGPVNGVLTFTRTGATTATQALTSTITGTALPASGNFSFVGGSCTGVSYTAPTLSLTVPSGSASCTVNVVPVDDTAVEGSQTVIAGVPTGPSAVGTGSAATVTIADNDTPPVFSVAKAGACAEALAPTNCTFTITRDGGVATATTVNFTVTGTATRATDYVLKTGGCAAGTALTANTISHPDANPLVIDVCPTDDAVIESGGETVIFTVTANPPTYTVGTASQTQNIADDDSPQVVTVSGGGAVAEAAGTGVFTFTRSGGSLAVQALPLTVNIGRSGSATYGAACTAGVDYTSTTTGTTLTLTGATGTITVTACDDNLIDPAETVIYTVAAPTAPADYTVGSPASATATITDDDVAVNAVAGATGSATATSTAEGTVVSFRVSCPTLATAQSIDFSITPATAYAGDVYSGSPTGSVSCPAAAASLVAVPTTVQTINDTTIGNARTYTMTISIPQVMIGAANNGLKAGGPSVAATIIGNAVATVNVTDDDQPVGVPTMSMLGLGFMSLMLAGFVAFQRRRVQK